MTVQQILPEVVVPGKRLGRNINHDPRSLSFVVAPRAHAAASVQWTRQTPVLDQGSIGSCTGQAMAGLLGTDPFFATMPPDRTLDEAEALTLYEAATRLDNVPGQYLPDDTGSDGLSVAKAAQQAGLISGYQHCTSVDGTITALQTGPVITGVQWYSGFDDPNPGGLVTLSGAVRGGHEFVLIGVDLVAKLLHAVNSWGPGWGATGHFYITFADFERLLSEQGDVTVPVPITSPAPQPKPSPTPIPTPSADPDLALATHAHSWLDHRPKHRGSSNDQLRQGLLDWLTAKGL